MPLRSPPSPPRVRDSLLARADRLTAFPLALVVAPAGSGKSTLLAEAPRRPAYRSPRSHLPA
jgi:ATP/maltotriose-dependent transcriptional regulator MalT